jgi:outer membrane lipoprotein-sorting protein
MSLKSIIISLVLLSSFASQAQYTVIEDISEFKTRVDALTESTMSMSSDFSQEKHLSFMSEPIVTKGIFKFMKPGSIRWEYTKPFSYILIIKDNQLLIDDEGNQNEIDLGNNAMFKEVNGIMSNALMGKVLEDDGKFSSVVEKSDKDYRITLLPKDETMLTYIQKIEVFFDLDSLIVSEVILRESEEDFTLIKFTNKALNANIDEAEFAIKSK